MAEYVRFPVERDVEVLVEISSDDYGFQQSTRDADGVLRAAETLQQALDRVRPVAAALVATLRELSPKETKVEFGIKLTGEAGALIAKTGAEGHFTVTLTFGQTVPR